MSGKNNSHDDIFVSSKNMDNLSIYSERGVQSFKKLIHSLRMRRNDTVNVLELGCILDGKTDCSDIILDTKYTKLYIPDGVMLVNSDAARALMQKELSGDGYIKLDSTFYRSDSMKEKNCYGIIPAKYVNNDWLGSIHLPNDQRPHMDMIHQIHNGWIFDRSYLFTEEQMASTPLVRITMWGQVYPENSVMFDENDEGTFTVCLSKAYFKYFDEDEQMWIQTGFPWIPTIYGLYNYNYKKEDEAGDYPFMKIDASNIKVFSDHVEIVINKKDIRYRVLHFGVDSRNVPKDKVVLLAGEFRCWIKEEELSGKFVSNVGFDLKVDTTNDSDYKIIHEYGGSRYYTVTNKPNHTRFMNCENRYELSFYPTKEYSEQQENAFKATFTQSEYLGKAIDVINNKGILYDTTCNAVIYNPGIESSNRFEAINLTSEIVYNLVTRQNDTVKYVLLGTRATNYSGEATASTDACSFHIKCNTVSAAVGGSYYESVVTAYKMRNQAEYIFEEKVIHDERRCGEKFIFFLNPNNKTLYVYFTCYSWSTPSIRLSPVGSYACMYGGFLPNKKAMSQFTVWSNDICNDIWTADEIYTVEDKENGFVFITGETTTTTE